MYSSVTKPVQPENVAAIHHEFLNDLNHDHANKTLDLLEKIDNNKFVICFSGHFSAGKSSIINELMGEELLPHSPIPTSANVVEISSGEGYARVFFKYEDPIQVNEPYDINSIKDYCMDGDTIQKVKISTNTNVIPKNVTILDTPGIDSSNDADRIITESSLHMVDVLFYVMDYNHVQSEVNLLFIKEMQNKGKPVYIIINQIDKHKDDEIPFSQFQASVSQAFANWEIEPHAIYYTSLKNKKHWSNQLEQVKDELKKLMKLKDERVEKTVEKSLSVLIEQHVDWLYQQKQDEMEYLQNQLHQLNTSSNDAPKEIQSKIDLYSNVKEQAQKEFVSIINTTLKNAYIMPYEVREKADYFLQSQQSGFKPKLFSTKKKVQNEKQRRLNQFYDSFMDRVEANIEWKLREKLLMLIEKLEINDSKNVEKVQIFSIDYPKQRLINLINEGARKTGEYLLVYTDDVTNDIQKTYKQNGRKLWEELLPSLNRKVDRTIESLTDKLSHIKKKSEVEQRLNELVQTFKQKENLLKNYLTEPISFPIDLTSVRAQRNQEITYRAEMDVEQNRTTEYSHYVNKSVEQSEDYHSVNDLIDNISNAQQLLHGIPGFDMICSDLSQKMERLENKKYTVALFGAFSAGKSSFANALIGEKVLPVSPNPTTAAINKISPPDHEHQHQSVLVKIKSEERLVEDLNELVPDSKHDSLQGYFNWFVTNKDQLERKQQLFLSSLSNGYNRFSHFLGKEFSIPLDELADYVATESIACYVEWTELFYDCAITKQGITLVDTPGADSINARHTDVTFQYIKEADAILYVTYYNHAFSKADREFLLQLGRVKDAFSLDKMFFIVNAADLAKDQSELKLVTNYVASRLQSFGIHHPRMYSISSHLALANKYEKNTIDSGIDKFEENFYHFINDELMDLLVRASINDLHRAKKQLKSYIHSASLSNEDKELQEDAYQVQRAKVEFAISNVNTQNYLKNIKQKAEKQVYYVEQRFEIQFHEYFKETFNPSTIKSNGKQAKLELEQSLKQLIKEAGNQLEQELRAVSLRLEAFLHTKEKELNNELNLLANQFEKELILPNSEAFSYTTPLINEAFCTLNHTIFVDALKLFKNTKAFFEKNEKRLMMDKIKQILLPYVKSYLSETNEQMINHYQQEWEQFVSVLQKKSLLSINNYFDGLTRSLSEEVDIGKLESTLTRIEEMDT